MLIISIIVQIIFNSARQVVLQQPSPLTILITIAVIMILIVMIICSKRSPASGPSAAPPSSSGESGPSSLSPGNHRYSTRLHEHDQYHHNHNDDHHKHDDHISSLSPVPGSHPPEARYSGTELVMLYDYKAQVVVIFLFIYSSYLCSYFHHILFIFSTYYHIICHVLIITDDMVILRPLTTCQYVEESGSMLT